jgi:carotenoid cleavage dioxygenase-like enzyme
MEAVGEARSNLGKTDHPYMSGVFSPNLKEYNVDALEVIEGKCPTDVSGVYLRNTEQPTHKPLGNYYHPFDGDAMLHQIFLDGSGNCSYRNRFVKTDGFLQEQEACRALWVGVSERDMSLAEKKKGWGAEKKLKDTSSTDVVVHAGKVLTMWYRCGEPYRLHPETLENLGKSKYFPADGISAHAKVDESTGELLFFNYTTKAPYMHYGVVSADEKLVHYVDIPLDAPKLPHDMCFSENYSILCDLATQFDKKLLEKGIFKNRTSRKPCRFALIPRFGTTEQVQFFEVKTTFVLHFLNAYEKKNENGEDVVVMDGYRQCVYDGGPNPHSPKHNNAWKNEVDKKYHKIFPSLGGMDILMTKLWRWQFNLCTGKTEEGPLDNLPDRLTEFGIFNQAYAGKKYRYAYSTLLKPAWLLFTGIVKHDLENNSSIAYHCSPNRYCSEPAFAPRHNPKSEDDGYLVTYITDMEKNQSEVLLLDGLNLKVVCRLRLPHRISSGTHACWCPKEFLSGGGLSKL